eukprot:SAG22_NODE_878_length_6715_cov_9.368652_8_plen_154_part_00
MPGSGQHAVMVPPVSTRLHGHASCPGPPGRLLRPQPRSRAGVAQAAAAASAAFSNRCTQELLGAGRRGHRSPVRCCRLAFAPHQVLLALRVGRSVAATLGLHTRVEARGDPGRARAQETPLGDPKGIVTPRPRPLALAKGLGRDLVMSSISRV